MMEKIYIFGAGGQGKELLKELRRVKSVEVAAFVDNDADKQGRKIDGVDCIGVEDVVKRGGTENIVLVSPVHSEDIINQLKQMNFTRVMYIGEWMQNWLQEQRYYRPITFEKTDFQNACPFNRYDSPYPDIVNVHKHDRELFDLDKEVKEIDFNVGRQLELVQCMKDVPLPDWSDEKDDIHRYYYDNSYFKKGSANVLYYMIRILRPKRIIEVGSGYSTAAMLDTNEQYFNNSIRITSIEPRTERLMSLLKSTDNLEICEKNLQEIHMAFFENLDENDILFIDSSHVSKMDSDVNYLFFEILPRLHKGVYIHFHDIFYPFIYPRKWIYEGRAYNEIYLLRAFLMNNNKYSIQFFGEMLSQKYSEKLCDNLTVGCSGSIWIRKMSE